MILPHFLQCAQHKYFLTVILAFQENRKQFKPPLDGGGGLGPAQFYAKVLRALVFYFLIISHVFKGIPQ